MWRRIHMRRRIHTSGHSLDASTMTGIVQIQPTMDKIADSPRQNTLSGRHHVSKETYK